MPSHSGVIPSDTSHLTAPATAVQRKGGSAWRANWPCGNGGKARSGAGARTTILQDQRGQSKTRTPRVKLTLGALVLGNLLRGEALLENIHHLRTEVDEQYGHNPQCAECPATLHGSVVDLPRAEESELGANPVSRGQFKFFEMRVLTRFPLLFLLFCLALAFARRAAAGAGTEAVCRQAVLDDDGATAELVHSLRASFVSPDAGGRSSTVAAFAKAGTAPGVVRVLSKVIAAELAIAPECQIDIDLASSAAKYAAALLSTEDKAGRSTAAAHEVIDAELKTPLLRLFRDDRRERCRGSFLVHLSGASAATGDAVPLLGSVMPLLSPTRPRLSPGATLGGAVATPHRLVFVLELELKAGTELEAGAAAGRAALERLWAHEGPGVTAAAMAGRVAHFYSVSSQTARVALGEECVQWVEERGVARGGGKGGFALVLLGAALCAVLLLACWRCLCASQGDGGGSGGGGGGSDGGDGSKSRSGGRRGDGRGGGRGGRAHGGRGGSSDGDGVAFAIRESEKQRTASRTATTRRGNGAARNGSVGIASCLAALQNRGLGKSASITRGKDGHQALRLEAGAVTTLIMSCFRERRARVFSAKVLRCLHAKLLAAAREESRTVVKRRGALKARMTKAAIAEAISSFHPGLVIEVAAAAGEVVKALTVAAQS